MVLTGNFDEDVGIMSPTMDVEVVPDISSLEPTVEVPVHGASDAASWSHNVPSGVLLEKFLHCVDTNLRYSEYLFWRVLLIIISISIIF